MRLSDLLHTAVVALAAHPVRTTLTALGMAIGTATTVLVVILGHGARDLLDERLESTGKNLIIIRPGTFSAEGYTPRAPMTRADAERLRQDATLTQLTTGVAEAQATLELVRNGTNQAATTISGVHIEAFRVRGWTLAAGRFLTRHDENTAAGVCVLGHTVRQTLFPGRTEHNIIGQKITFQNIPLTVVGILQPRGRDPLGRDHDDEVFIPLSLCESRVTHTTNLTIMIAVARTAEDIPGAVLRIRQLLRDQHRLQGDDLDDHDIVTVQEMAEIGVLTMFTMNVLTILLAAIVLTVGAIGVMATLLATVGEQTREIGLRTCLGALPGDIRNQLLVEALLVTLTGGGLGIGIGVVLAQVITQSLAWPCTVTLAHPLLGLMILCAIGIMAGLYPAYRAGRLDPVVALHAD